MNKEKWVQIEGYPDYLVSDNGRICSLKSGLLKPGENSRGYMLVNLSGDTKRLHRIVAGAFIPNPEGKEIVNHIDGNTKNNAVSNLEWVTNSENQKHSREILKNNSKPKSVVKLDEKGVVVGVYSSIRECEHCEAMTEDSLRDHIRKGTFINGYLYKIAEKEEA